MQSDQRHPAGAASPGGTGLISPSLERSAQLPGKVGSVDEFLDRPVQQAVPVQPPQYFGSLPVSDRPVQREYSPAAGGNFHPERQAPGSRNFQPLIAQPDLQAGLRVNLQASPALGWSSAGY